MSASASAQRRLNIVAGLTARVVDAEPTAAAARPPILFVHGMFGGAWMFGEMQRWFAARGWSSHAIDLRGHHGSHPVADIGRVSVHDYIEDTLAVARALDRPVVIGHSMGGLIAQGLAERDSVRAAVLMASAAPRGISVLRPRLLARELRYAPGILRSRAIRLRRADGDRIVFSRMPATQRSALYGRLIPESGRAAREMALGGIAIDEREVRCPVMVVAGAADRMLAPRVARRLATKYGAPLTIEPEFGHYLIGEPGWERIAEKIERWLGSTAGVA